MSEYHTILILSFLRLLLACGILFMLVPAVVFPSFPSKSRTERLMGMALFMAGATMVMMHVFVLLKLNDNIAVLIISLWIIAFKWWTVYRRQHVGFVLIKSVLLRWIEILARPSTVKRFGTTIGDVWKRERGARLAYWTLFVVIVAGAVVLRIGPIWDHPAPLSTEYYETLEQVKHLQINEMYTGGERLPMGMPIIISALCTASQVNPTLAVHFFGVLSVVLISASMFFSVYTATHNRIGAAFACVIVAVAYALFPGSVNHEIEADSLTCAVVFLLPSLSFFITYITDGGRARLFAALSGIVATASIDLFAGCLGLLAMGAILCSSFFILPSLPRLRKRVLVLHAIATAAAAGTAAVCYMYISEHEAVRNALTVIFYNEHFYRYLSYSRGSHPDSVRIAVFLAIGAAVFAFLIIASMVPTTAKRWHLHLIGWGNAGILFILLAQPMTIGLGDVVPAAQVIFVLTVVAALAAGLCVAVVLDLAERTLALLRVAPAGRGWMSTAAGLVMIAAVTVLFRGTGAAAPMTAEPDGFVRNLYRIERTFIPYQWTIVAHHGILLAGMNRGRFLDYDYFTAMYDPVSYRHGAPGSIPTALVFIFIEKDRDVTGISSELMPINRDAMNRTREWCDTYRKTHSDMSVFYSDEKIIIYELRDPRVHSLRV